MKDKIIQILGLNMKYFRDGSLRFSKEDIMYGLSESGILYRLHGKYWVEILESPEK